MKEQVAQERRQTRTLCDAAGRQRKNIFVLAQLGKVIEFNIDCSRQQSVELRVVRMLRDDCQQVFFRNLRKKVLDVGSDVVLVSNGAFVGLGDGLRDPAILYATVISRLFLNALNERQTSQHIKNCSLYDARRNRRNHNGPPGRLAGFPGGNAASRRKLEGPGYQLFAKVADILFESQLKLLSFVPGAFRGGNQGVSKH